MVISKERWLKENAWESAWWGDCINTLAEETKQSVYAEKMGLQFDNYRIDLGGRSVIDLGGGPVSLLLKCDNIGRGVVVDPCQFPDWIKARYHAAGIVFVPHEAERLLSDDHFDEVWIYNVLQHTRDPQRIVINALRMGRIVRIFEWINMPATIGHPHVLSAVELNDWLHGRGAVATINDRGAIGTCYYGTFAHIVCTDTNRKGV